MGLDVRAIEHALLTGKWDDRLSASEDAPVVKFAHNVVNGDFSDLKSQPSRDLFTVTASTEATLDRPFPAWFKFSDPSTGTSSVEDELLRLVCAVGEE